MGAAPGDRWFLGEGPKRTGPVPFEELVRLLLGEADPRAALVWHKGFGPWTRAEDVPEVERRLVPALARAAAVPATSGAASSALVLAHTGAIDDGKPGGPLLVYGSLGLGVIAMALVGSLFWPQPGVQEAPPVIVLPAPSPTAPPVPVPPPPHVSPDRRRPGLNPLDTGAFEAEAGPRPEGFRWDIESARGYAPR